MLVVRAYPVLSSLVVEITCVGHRVCGDEAGHLIIRTTLDEHDGTLAGVLANVEETVQLAHREYLYGDLDVFDECAL